jgi:cell division transport system permease protein
MRPRENSLLPLEDAREAALFFVVGALCFLAALAALSAKSTYGAARAWTAEVEGEFTVSLSGADASAADAAAKLLAGVEGVTAARAFSDAEIAELLAPNFGQSGLPADLPVPRLIAVTAEEETGPAISRALHDAGYDAAVDSHTEWAGDVRHMLAIARIAALSIVALLGFTAIAVIAFATHAALLARRDIVDVLHVAGARDRFIAGLFERRFWLLGLRAGTVGALVALASVAILIALGRSNAERTGLLPQLSLDFPDLAVLVVTPVIAGLAARLAARITVMRSLKSVM